MCDNTLVTLTMLIFTHDWVLYNSSSLHKAVDLIKTPYITDTQIVIDNLFRNVIILMRHDSLQISK